MAKDHVGIPHRLFLPAMRPVREETWQPRADVYRMPGGWLVRLELAGVCPEDVHLIAQNATLVVQGTRRDECAREGLDCHLLEISYSRFERVVDLPGMMEPVAITTFYVNGMLTVRIVTEGRP